MRTAYRVLAYLIALAVVYQASAIAFGMFGFVEAMEGGAVFGRDSDAPNAGPAMHAIGGMMVIPALTILLLISSFFAKVNSGIKWALLVLLVVFVQVNLGFFAFDLPAIGLLHAINAFVLLGVALIAARKAGRTDVTRTAAAETARV